MYPFNWAFCAKIDNELVDIKTLFHNLRLLQKPSSSHAKNIPLKWLFSFMNCCNMFVHIYLLRTAVVTKVTFKRLLSFINWHNMPHQFPLFWKSSITNVALVRVLSFMNWCYVSNLKSQTLHKKVWFPHELKSCVHSNGAFVQS